MTRGLVNYASGGGALVAYATPADLGVWLDADPSADALRLLSHAMRLVDSSIASAMFGTDASGNPTDAGILAALRDMTCAQVEWWLANGDELAAQNQYGSFSIEGIMVSRIGGQTAYRLCDRAKDIGKLAKLVPGTVVVT